MDVVVLPMLGPLIALATITAVVALGSRGNGPELGDVGTVWAEIAIDPQEG